MSLFKSTRVEGAFRFIMPCILAAGAAVGLLAGCGRELNEEGGRETSPAAQKDFGDMTIMELQEMCLAYTAPPEEIVVEQDSTAAKLLIENHPGVYHNYWDSPYENGFQNFGMKPPKAGPIAMRVAPPWAALSSRVNFRPSFPNYEKGGTLFCGERFTPSGERRLVVIQYVATPTPYLYFSPSVDLVALVITPAREGEIPKDYALEHNHGVWVTNVVVPQPVRIYAGQADPKDRSHLTFAYHLNGKSDVVDVWLADDESIRATPRSPIVNRGWGAAPSGSGGTIIRGTPEGGIEVIGP